MNDWTRMTFIYYPAFMFKSVMAFLLLTTTLGKQFTTDKLHGRFVALV